jgi:DNA-binding MarR family transcriptional regulator
MDAQGGSERERDVKRAKAVNFNGLDTAVHGPIRLGALTALQVDGPHDFTTLKARLQVGDGSLALHLGKLEEAGYVTCEKSFVGRRPKSTYQITPAGYAALRQYLDAMQQVIDLVKQRG